MTGTRLHYVNEGASGIRRERHGKGFGYRSARGRPVRDHATLVRIRRLAIPPAWEQVWISSDPAGHIQATGRDARGRKQYRYHARWREVRDEAKYDRFVAFCGALPKIRARVARDLKDQRLSKRKVLATIVSLMERAQLRVGNEEYARHNHSYGATTLRTRHARFPSSSSLVLDFRGKGGIHRHVHVSDRRLARIVRACYDLPGQRLFQYVDENDAVHPVTSNDVNEYLRHISGGPFTAKDYRTWAATLSAALLLSAVEPPDTLRARKAYMREVVATVAARLGHTPTICRTSYIHPRLLDDFLAAKLTLAARVRQRVNRRAPRLEHAIDAFRAIESIVARYLETTRTPRLVGV